MVEITPSKMAPPDQEYVLCAPDSPPRERQTSSDVAFVEGQSARPRWTADETWRATNSPPSSALPRYTVFPSPFHRKSWPRRALRPCSPFGHEVPGCMRSTENKKEKLWGQSKKSTCPKHYFVHVRFNSISSSENKKRKSNQRIIYSTEIFVDLNWLLILKGNKCN